MKIKMIRAARLGRKHIYAHANYNEWEVAYSFGESDKDPE